MCHHQEIACQGGSPGLSFQTLHKGKAGHAAGPGIEHGAGKTSDFQIIRDQRAGSDHNVIPVKKRTSPFAGPQGGSQGRKKEKDRKSKGDSIDNLAVGKGLLSHKTTVSLY